MTEAALKSIGKKFDYRVNCFCISELYYRQTQFRQSTADEMLNFVSENFQQVEESGPKILTLVWSRSSFEIPIGQIKVRELAKRLSGFPFGLVLEHSFVQMGNGLIFQKPDPTLHSEVEITSLTNAVSPYLNMQGFELTRHRSSLPYFS